MRFKVGDKVIIRPEFYVSNDKKEGKLAKWFNSHAMILTVSETDSIYGVVNDNGLEMFYESEVFDIPTPSDIFKDMLK